MKVPNRVELRARRHGKGINSPQGAPGRSRRERLTNEQRATNRREHERKVRQAVRRARRQAEDDQ